MATGSISPHFHSYMALWPFALLISVVLRHSFVQISVMTESHLAGGKVEVCLVLGGPDLLCGDTFSVIVDSWMGHEWVKWEEAEGIKIYAGMHVDKNK